jgi:hypothetical protein
VLWALLFMSTRSIGALAVPLAIVLLGGCSESTVPPAGVYHPTLISIAPAAFLGSVPCVAAKGAMRAYVGTMFNLEYLADGSLVTTDDVAQGDALVGGMATADGGAVSCSADADPGTTPRAIVGFELPSTGPVDCQQSVSIGRVVPGHRYRAEIQGYDRADLVALAPGVPILVDPATGERVEPLWKFSCGDDCPENAVSYDARSIGNCKLVEDHSAVSSGNPASVVVTTDAFAGTTSCGSESGKLDHFVVSYDELGQSTSQTATCGGQIELDGVPVRGTLTMDVFAFEAGNPEARWGTTCTAAPVAGLVVPAACAPLQEQGSLVLKPADVLAALGSDCGALEDLPAELKLELVEAAGAELPSEQQPEPRYLGAETCAQGVRYSSLERGAATVRATLSSGPSELGHALCTATITPAHTAVAHCSLEP